MDIFYYLPIWTEPSRFTSLALTATGYCLLIKYLLNSKLGNGLLVFYTLEIAFALLSPLLIPLIKRTLTPQICICSLLTFAAYAGNTDRWWSLYLISVLSATPLIYQAALPLRDWFATDGEIGATLMDFVLVVGGLMALQPLAKLYVFLGELFDTQDSSVPQPQDSQEPGEQYQDNADVEFDFDSSIELDVEMQDADTPVASRQRSRLRQRPSALPLDRFSSDKASASSGLRTPPRMRVSRLRQRRPRAGPPLGLSTQKGAYRAPAVESAPLTPPSRPLQQPEDGALLDSATLPPSPDSIPSPTSTISSTPSQGSGRFLRADAATIARDLGQQALSGEAPHPLRRTQWSSGSQTHQDFCANRKPLSASAAPFRPGIEVTAPSESSNEDETLLKPTLQQQSADEAYYAAHANRSSWSPTDAPLPYGFTSNTPRSTPPVTSFRDDEDMHMAASRLVLETPPFDPQLIEDLQVDFATQRALESWYAGRANKADRKLVDAYLDTPPPLTDEQSEALRAEMRLEAAPNPYPRMTAEERDALRAKLKAEDEAKLIMKARRAAEKASDAATTTPKSDTSKLPGPEVGQGLMASRWATEPDSPEPPPPVVQQKTVDELFAWGIQNNISVSCPQEEDSDEEL